MALFVVAFRTRSSEGEKSANAFSKTLNGLAEQQYRIEPATFSLLEFKGTSQELTQQLSATPGFDPAVDTLITINLSRNGYSAAGRVPVQALQQLMEKR